jgi:predicted TIM-barrel fold metal-dependent hydrolase
MSFARGIYVVDTHVHAQRHAFGFKKKGINPDYAVLSGGLAQADAYDNSPRLLYHMDRYGIDVCVIQPGFGMTNEINLKIMEDHPERFVAFCRDVKTQHKSLRTGEQWSVKDAVKEIDDLLATGMFKGIGESIPRSRVHNRKRLTWDERLDEICEFMELARKYKVAISYHTGFPSGYGADLDRGRAQGHYETVESANPLLCHEVAALYPDVPIILAHGGIEGSGYYSEYYTQCLNVAASHPNVYLECGQWWAELYEKPLQDPNIGCEKLLWGTDWGASCTAQSWMPGQTPETYCNQDIKLGPPAHQVDIWGWALRELSKLNIPQDDMNLILGGNAVRLFDIQTPFTRLFKDYPKKQK